MSVLSTTDQAFITKLTGIITANLGNADFGAKELAQEAGLSRPRLNRKLLTVIGKTATQFILDIRLGISMQMLRSGDITAAEVAYKTGFSSPAYFNTCFHKHFGYPPGKVKVSEDKLQKDSIHEQKKRSARRKNIYILSGVLILAVAGYVIHFARSGTPEKSIAVLPFRNLSSEITDQYIYDGIMDEIFNNLSKVQMLRVISRNSVEQYRNTARATTDIARELNVNYIIVGTGQKVGNTFCLRVQLIEVRNKKEIDLWADSYEQDLLEIKNLFRIQNQIAQVIVAELKATLTPGEKEIIEKVPTQNIAAYDLYRKAKGYQKDYEGTRNLSSYQTAVNLYNTALVID
jgi:TolB-like protein/AraC-like DNA-binding protein